MSNAGLARLRVIVACSLSIATVFLLAGCQGGSPSIDEVAELGTTVKFDSQTFGVPVSPRVTHSLSVRKGGGRSQIGKPYKVRGQWYYPKDEPGYSRTGQASWYGPNFHGRLTANGETYDMNGLSAAHKTFPLPSYAMVTNLQTGSHVMVRVNDRGPYAHGREIDVSSTVADLLGFKGAGMADVRVDYVGRAPVDGDDTEMLMASYQPGSGGEESGVMMASTSSTAGSRRGAASVLALTDGSGSIPGLPGVERRGTVVPVPQAPDYSASYASRPGTNGAVAALRTMARDDESERIALGLVAGPTLQKVRSVAFGRGRLLEEAVPGTDAISATLVVATGEDSDALLQRLWQVGADEAFVIRD